MPYIDPKIRERFDGAIRWIADSISEGDAAKGELNYVVSSILHRVLKRRGLRYHNLNDLVGVLTCCQLELYRKVAAPYEDEAERKNGPIE